MFKLNRSFGRCITIVVAVFIVSFLLSSGLYLVTKATKMAADDDHAASNNRLTSDPKSAESPASPRNRAKVALFNANSLYSGYMDHVMNVFHRCGYDVVDVSTSPNSPYQHWDVLWSHNYPFGVPALKTRIRNHQQHQKINHFPGTGFITNKVNIAKLQLKSIPKAFAMPKEKNDLLKYIKENPNKMWVQKNNNHRGIYIKKSKDIELNKTGSFIQEYIDRPFLIDNRRFDIGIYVTLTSIEPLRVYVHDTEWLMRFCSQDYEPFDASEKNKYVITDDYTPIWMIKSLDRYYNKNKLSVKNSLFAYLTELGKDPRELERNIKSTISEIYKIKEESFNNLNKKYTPNANFFEMVRFDFIFDENLKIYLLEVNMSPNLSSIHFKQNGEMYEKILYSMFSLVGIARDTVNPVEHVNIEEENMLVSDRDISVSNPICNKCSCRDENCQICLQCMSHSTKKVLKKAYLEHISKKEWSNIYPGKFTLMKPTSSFINKVHHRWYQQKFNY